MEVREGDNHASYCCYKNENGACLMHVAWWMLYLWEAQFHEYDKYVLLSN